MLTWGLSLYEQSSEHFIIFSKYKHQNIAWLNFREMANNVNILEQVISIPEVDHFILALNYHLEIVSFRIWPAAHSSNTRCRISIIRSNLFHQKILSCRIMLSLSFFFLTAHPCIIFSKWSQLVAHHFLVYLFQVLCMFRATVFPSSWELSVSMRHW